MLRTTELTLDVETAFPSDVSANENLRTAVLHVRDFGWENPAGEWLLAGLHARGASWAAKIDHWCNRSPGTLAPEDVVTACWYTITRFPDGIVAATAPWAYLWISVRNALAVEIVAESVLSSSCARRRHADRPDRPLRVGLDSQHLDSASETISAERPSHRSDGLTTLITILADNQPEMTTFWADVVERALDVMADSRRSYEETNLRRDAYLLHEVGLTVDELSALAALLIGPRRGDRAAQSLLLALRRDPTTSVDAVPGALRRVRLLQARTLATTTSTAA